MFCTQIFISIASRITHKSSKVQSSFIKHFFFYGHHRGDLAATHLMDKDPDGLGNLLKMLKDAQGQNFVFCFLFNSFGALIHVVHFSDLK